MLQFIENLAFDVNTLYLVLATSEDHVDNVGVGENFGTSDHQQVTFEAAFNASFYVGLHKSRKKKKSRHGNVDSGRVALDRINWVDIFSKNDMDVAW